MAFRLGSLLSSFVIYESEINWNGPRNSKRNKSQNREFVCEWLLKILIKLYPSLKYNIKSWTRAHFQGLAINCIDYGGSSLSLILLP